MSTLIIDHEQVRRLLPMAECIEVVAAALEALADGEALQPLRSCTWLPDRTGLLGVMPGHLGRPSVLGIKVVTVFPGNHGTELDAHQGAVMIFSPGNGRLLAIMDASEITAIRTAAASAVATRALARQQAKTLAILGTGVQGASHLEAMALVRQLDDVRIWSRRPERARCFAERAAAQYDARVETASSAEEAVRGADIICTTTASETPIVRGGWLAPGAHVNAVGACLPRMRELDTDAVKRARVIVDRRESALHEAGDLIIPIAEGAITEDHIAGELGEVLIGRVRGRTAPDQVTVFESLGLAVEDLAAAHAIYEKARHATKAGLAVELGGQRRETP